MDSSGVPLLCANPWSTVFGADESRNVSLEDILSLCTEFRNIVVPNANTKNRAISTELARLENDELPSSAAISLIFLVLDRWKGLDGHDTI